MLLFKSMLFVLAFKAFIFKEKNWVKSPKRRCWGKMAKKSTFDVSKHILVPKHTKMTQKETKELFEKYNLSFDNLPKIIVSDPGVKDLKLKEGDVIKIERQSVTAGTNVYYRGVVNE